MPAPGDQHSTWANPFEEGQRRVSEWSAKDIATISARLDKQLGPEYISARAGPGGTKVHYLTAEKCIALANEVFGFNGWSSSIQNIQVDFADENPQTQRVSIGLSVIVRVTLRDGTYHEDIGYGSTDNAKGKAMAFEKAKKEGTTDGLKRALRNFGNVLGNCIYDKNYVSQVIKIKAQPVKKFEEDNLHRHADFVKKDLPKVETAGNTTENALKTEPSESFDDFLGDLDEADFCVPEDGDLEIAISATSAATSGQHGQPQAPKAAEQTNGSVSGTNHGRQTYTPNNIQPRPLPPNEAQMNRGNTTTSHPQLGAPGANAQEPVAFFSARAVNQLPESSLQGQGTGQPVAPHAQQLFNPKAESPSIRKTPGIDHSSSKPLARNGQHVAPAASQTTSTSNTSNGSGFTPVRPGSVGPQAGRGNIVNPSLDQARRIGAPSGPGSPLGNRNSYRPPSMKRPLPGEAIAQAGTRPPLVDVPANRSTSGPAAVTAAGFDAKRQKMT